MTIRIYPSRLPGEPLETHEHGSLTLHEWFIKNVTGYTHNREHPVAVEVNGVGIPPAEWPLCHIKPDTSVRVYPVPYGTGLEIAAWVAVGVAVASAAYSIIMMGQMGSSGYSSSSNGDSLELSPAKANTAKLGDPIREIFGRYRVWPDYVVQPFSRFDDDNPKIYRTNMFVCVGVGNMSTPQSSIKIGATPIASFGDDVSYTIYPPGTDVSSDYRTENWFNATEVGNTTSGTSGLDLGSSGPDTVSIGADAFMVSGNAITVIGGTSSDDDTDIPESWAEGTIITVESPATYTVTTEAGASVFYGALEELNAYVGMPVTLKFNSIEYDLFVSSYASATAAVPGVGGNAASITGSAAPTTYDFSSSAVVFTVTWQGSTYTISLSTNYTTMSGVVQSITEQLSGSGVVAQDESGIISITEESSPFVGGAITHSSLPTSVFGSSPVSVTGTASSGGSPAVLAHVKLAYASATGTAFTGMPEGSQRITLQHYKWQYKITEIDGFTITVDRLIEDPETGTTHIDEDWPGFNERTLLDGSVTGVNDSYNWMGPFSACPDGETTSHFEINTVFPSGLATYSDKGRIQTGIISIIVQYRTVGADDWTERRFVYTEATNDAIGFTHSFDLDTASQIEVRMRREQGVAGGSTRDIIYWQALRSRLSKRPTSYANVTTMAITVRTGNRIAAQSDRRVNLIPTRVYDGPYPSRSISGAIYHVLSSLGFTDDQIDVDAITELETNYWTARGETFDFATSDSVTALEMLQTISNAGMGYFLLSDGLASVGREGIKPWVGIITPQEMTEPMQTAFSAPSDDDYDGVDVTYINGTTWAEETVQCRTSDNPTPSKVEDYTLDGVLTADRAYQIGMRRLMKYLKQRLTHTTTTEMDALCYNMGDRIVLTDDVPGTTTISCLIESMEYDTSVITLRVSEPLDWTLANPRCLIRFQDGSASTLLTPTQIDDYTLSVPYSSTLHPDDWEMENPSIEPPRLVFCDSSRVGYDAIVSDITPNSDGTCPVTAVQYRADFYAYDDAVYPGDVA